MVTLLRTLLCVMWDAVQKQSPMPLFSTATLVHARTHAPTEKGEARQRA